MKEAEYLESLHGASGRPSGLPSSIDWSDEDRSSRRSDFETLLVRAGIRISPISYICGCVSVGLLLGTGALSSGPLFGTFLGAAATYELMVALPKEWAARREVAVARDLAACAEGLGQRIRGGLPLESALIQTLQSLPHGELSYELSRLVYRLQRGVSPESALHEFGARLRGPEVRSFVVAVRMCCLSGHQLGEPLIRLASFLRRHRASAREIMQKVALYRQLYSVVFAGLAVLGIFVCRFLPEEILLSDVPLMRFTQEVGAIAIVISLLLVMRLTATRAWEVADDDD